MHELDRAWKYWSQACVNGLTKGPLHAQSIVGHVLPGRSPAHIAALAAAAAAPAAAPAPAPVMHEAPAPNIGSSSRRQGRRRAAGAVDVHANAVAAGNAVATSTDGENGVVPYAVTTTTTYYEWIDGCLVQVTEEEARSPYPTQIGPSRRRFW